MKVNKPKAPFAGEVDGAEEKKIAKALKGERFAETLSAMETAVPGANASQNAARGAMVKIALQYDLSHEESKKAALRESAELLVKSRLNEKLQNSGKAVEDLSNYISEDPYLKTKLLSILQNLRDETN